MSSLAPRRTQAMASLLATLLCGARALAADADADAASAADARPINEVTVAADRASGARPVSPSTSSSTTIEEAEVDAARPADLAELLSRAPGVQARQDTGAGQRLDISMRGLDGGRSRRVVVLEDGIPIAANPYAEPDLLYATPPERLRAIEVVKGVDSLVYGPQTVGGVVNLLTFLPPPRRTTIVDAMLGTRGYSRVFVRHGDSASPRARAGDRAAPWAYAVQASRTQGDGFRGEDFEAHDVAAKGEWRGERARLRVSLGFHDDDNAADAVGLTEGLYAQNPRTRTVAPFDRARLRRWSASLTIEDEGRARRPLRGSVLLFANTMSRLFRRQVYTRSAAGYDAADFDRVVGDPTVPLGALYFLPRASVQDRTYEVGGIEPRLVHRVRSGGGAVVSTLTAGARLIVERSQQSVRTGERSDTFEGPTTNEETHRSVGLAVYAREQAEVADAVLATAAVRFEYVDFRREILRETTASGPIETSRVGDESVSSLVPGVGLSGGGRTVRVFANVHGGFAPPRLVSIVTPRADAAQAGGSTTAQVSAESGTMGEFGLRLAVHRRLSLEHTVFGAVYRNQVVPAGGGEGQIEVDGGATRRLGFELATNVVAARISSTKLTIRGRYTALAATFAGGVDRGRTLPYAPRQSGGVVATWAGALDGSGIDGVVSAASTFTGRQFTDPANTVAPDVTGRVGELPARAVFDLTVEGKHRASGLAVRLMVKNLFDDVRVIARRPDGIFPSSGRQVLVGLRYSFEEDSPS